MFFFHFFPANGNHTAANTDQSQREYHDDYGPELFAIYTRNKPSFSPLFHINLCLPKVKLFSLKWNLWYMYLETMNGAQKPFNLP